MYTTFTFAGPRVFHGGEEQVACGPIFHNGVLMFESLKNTEDTSVIPISKQSL